MALRSVKNILFLAVIFPSQKVPPLHPPLMPFRGPYLFPHNHRPLPRPIPWPIHCSQKHFWTLFFLVTKNSPLPIPWPHSSLSPRHLAIGQIQRFLHHTTPTLTCADMHSKPSKPPNLFLRAYVLHFNRFSLSACCERSCASIAHHALLIRTKGSWLKSSDPEAELSPLDPCCEDNSLQSCSSLGKYFYTQTCLVTCLVT